MLNPAILTSVQYDRQNPHVITATLGKDGPPVVITRYLNVWKAHVRVTVGGVTVHDAEAQEGDTRAFTELRRLGLDQRDRDRDAHLARMKDLAAALFLPPAA